MKKMFIMFVLFLTLLPIWADIFQSSVTVRTSVSKITLSQASASEDGTLGLYKLYGGFDSADSAKLDYLEADDISQSDVTVYFRVAQLAKTRTDESIHLSVEAESLVNTESQYLMMQGTDLKTSTSVPVISNISCLGMDYLMVTYSTEQGNAINFTLVYKMGVVENVNLAFFTTTWKKTEGLAPGLYTSKITLRYITN